MMYYLKNLKLLTYIRSKLCTFFLFVCLWTFCSNITYGQTYSIPPQFQNNLKIQVFNTKQGLAQGIVYDIVQDKQGFMWFATQGGLSRYDGKRFKNYKHNPDDSLGLSSSYVNALHTINNGDIWVGTTKGLNRFDSKLGKPFLFAKGLRKKSKKKKSKKGKEKTPQTDSTKKIHKHLSHSDILSLFQDNSGTLWIITLNGLNRVITSAANQKAGFKDVSAMTYRHYLLNSEIHHIYQDRSGVIWVAIKGGLYYWDKKQDKFIDYNIQVKNKIINRVLEDSKGRFWVGDYAGNMYLLNRKTGKTTRYPISLISGTYSIYEDRRGIIWMMSSEALYWYDEFAKEFKTFRHPDIKVSGGYTVYEDRSGGLWIGTSGSGVYLIDSKSYKFGGVEPVAYDVPTQGSNNIWAVNEVNGELQLITNGKGLLEIDRKTGKYSVYTKKESDPTSISSSKLYRMYRDKSGDLWIGTIDGLNKFDAKTKKFKRFFLDKSRTVGYWISAMLEDSQGNFWVASGWHGLYKVDQKTGKVTKEQPLEKKQRIRFICEGDNGILWMSLGGSLSMFNPKEKDEKKRFRVYSPQDTTTKIGGSTIMQILKTRAGQLWITSYGNGLGKVMFRKDGSLYIHYYTQKNGFSSNILYHMLEDKQGVLWISSNKGITKFDPKTETATVYTESDGLQSDDFNNQSFYQNPSGEFFFGCANGVVNFYPEKVKNNEYLPPIVLTDFQLADKSIEVLQANEDKQSLPFEGNVNQVKKIILTYEQATVFSFEFAALSYISAEDNLYRVKMDGYEKNWRNLEERNFATYTGLSHGTYTFQVQASNNDGVWNTKGLSIEIVILPAWWQTWWFKVSWISFIVLSVFGFYQYRISAIKRQKRVLENKVVERTKEIAEKNTVLQIQKEEIVAQNEELQQQSEEIMAQRDAIEGQNKTLADQNLHIKQSIRSAQTIQAAILPFEERMQEDLNEHFVLFHPRDVVSGDFYLMEKIGAKIILSAIDCTGHGVPGAFMSLIGYALLNEIIKAKQMTNPSEILEKLRFELRHALKQDQTGDKNGMDAAMITIDYNNQDQDLVKVLFAGAKRPLWYMDANKEIHKIKGSSVSIGIDYDDERQIITKELMLPKGTTLYLSSDGLADQNNVRRKKFGNKLIQSILIEHGHLPLVEQQKALDEALGEFMKGTVQRDDILLMGVRI